MALPSSAIQMFEANPTATMLSIVPTHPIIKTGLRPMRSDSPPQYMPITASAREKEEIRRPA